MSGGSWDYVYLKFEEVAEKLSESKSAERQELGKLICLIAAALHDIEWADSYDNAPGSELEAIRKALKK